MKPGILKNKNGIAILAAMGYPQTIVDNANAISLALREKYNI
jgi:DNA mismatch repair ATPase MutS